MAQKKIILLITLLVVISICQWVWAAGNQDTIVYMPDQEVMDKVIIPVLEQISADELKDYKIKTEYLDLITEIRQELDEGTKYGRSGFVTMAGVTKLQTDVFLGIVAPFMKMGGLAKEFIEKGPFITGALTAKTDDDTRRELVKYGAGAIPLLGLIWNFHDNLKTLSDQQLLKNDVSERLGKIDKEIRKYNDLLSDKKKFLLNVQKVVEDNRKKKLEEEKKTQEEESVVAKQGECKPLKDRSIVGMFMNDLDNIGSDCSPK